MNKELAENERDFTMGLVDCRIGGYSDSSEPHTRTTYYTFKACPVTLLSAQVDEDSEKQFVLISKKERKLAIKSKNT